MKKFFFLAVAAVVALAACTKNEADTTSFEKAKVINFNTVAGKATKAPISGTTYSYDCPAFGVFASYLEKDKTWAANKATATRYMDDVEVSFNDTKDIWAPASTYYWPLEGSLSFIAYSPKAAATAAFHRLHRGKHCGRSGRPSLFFRQRRQDYERVLLCRWRQLQEQ